MKQLLKYRTSFAILFLVVGAFLFLFTPQHTFAATKTWAGTSVGDIWDDANNWSPSGVPVDNDDIVFNCATEDECDSVFDLPGLIVNSISFEGDVAAVVANPTDAPMTILGDITSVNPGSRLEAALVLGADSTVHNTVLGAVDLNGNTLTITGKGEIKPTTSDRWIGLEGEISGDGTLNIDADADQEVYLSGPNTYSGTTNVNSGMFVSNGQHLTNRTIDMFGVSDINVGPLGKVILFFDETESGFSFENTMTFTRTNPSYTQLEIGNDASDSSLVEMALTSIVLNSDTRFDLDTTNGDITIDLAGITDNGYCIEFGLDGVDEDSFLNGPSCTAPAPVDDLEEEEPVVADETPIPNGVDVTGASGRNTAAVSSIGATTLLLGLWRGRKFLTGLF